MVCIQFATDLHYELIYPGADTVFNIPTAQTANPLAVGKQLQISHVYATDHSDPLAGLRPPSPSEHRRDAPRRLTPIY